MQAIPGGQPLISVIIPVYDDTERLGLCLADLATQTIAEPVEILVIDNGSTESLAALRAAFPSVRWLSEAKPGSYNARNTGIAAAAGEILAFTDSDCRPAPDWLRNAVGALRSMPVPGFVGGRIDLITTGAARLSSAELFDLAVGFPQKRFVEQVHFAMTANMVTHAATMAAVGGFDGSLKSGGDREWGNRAWKAGKRGMFADDALVRHPTRSTPAEVLKRIRRVAGGERDRHPGWRRALLFSARHLLPPRQAIRDIVAIDPAIARPTAKLGAILFAVRTRIVLIGQRIALQVHHGESNRA